MEKFSCICRDCIGKTTVYPPFRNISWNQSSRMSTKIIYRLSYTDNLSFPSECLSLLEVKGGGGALVMCHTQDLCTAGGGLCLLKTKVSDLLLNLTNYSCFTKLVVCWNGSPAGRCCTSTQILKDTFICVRCDEVWLVFNDLEWKHLWQRYWYWY